MQSRPFSLLLKMKWYILLCQALTRHCLRQLEATYQPYLIYPEEVIKLIPSLTPTQQNTITEEIKKAGKVLAEDFDRILRGHVRQSYIDPVIDTVEYLPISELAAMAESLVNLTSFKRRITMVPETVGGPIDVAVISKGDGFIWISRKHYFKRELNPQFAANYYR